MQSVVIHNDGTLSVSDPEVHVRQGERLAFDSECPYAVEVGLPSPSPFGVELLLVPANGWAKTGPAGDPGTYKYGLSTLDNSIINDPVIIVDN